MSNDLDEIAKLLGYIILLLIAGYAVWFSFRLVSEFYRGMSSAYKTQGMVYATTILASFVIMFSGWGWMFYGFGHQPEYTATEVGIPFGASQLIGIFMMARARTKTAVQGGSEAPEANQKHRH